MAKISKLDILIGVLFVIVIYMVCCYLYAFTSHREYKYHDYTFTTNFEVKNYTFTNEEITKIINKEMGLHYFVIKTDLASAGLTNIPIRNILIDKDLSGYDFAETLVHELCHLKYMCQNEQFVQFMTFKTLYESENEILHDIGCNFANNVSKYEYGKRKNYDCGYYIEQYFKGGACALQ